MDLGEILGREMSFAVGNGWKVEQGSRKPLARKGQESPFLTARARARAKRDDAITPHGIPCKQLFKPHVTCVESCGTFGRRGS